MYRLGAVESVCDLNVDLWVVQQVEVIDAADVCRAVGVRGAVEVERGVLLAILAGPALW